MNKIGKPNAKSENMRWLVGSMSAEKRETTSKRAKIQPTIEIVPKREILKNPGRFFISVDAKIIFFACCSY